MKRKKMIVRWSIVTTGLIALFWAIWYLVAGKVPVVASIKVNLDWIYILPFGLSRWWDILIGPIWSVVGILLLTSQTLKEDEDLFVGLLFGLGFGLVFGLGFGIVIGLVVGLIISSAVSVGFSLVVLAKWIASTNFWTKVWNWLLVK